MKRVLLIACLLCSIFTLRIHAQHTDTRIAEVYGDSLQPLMQRDPERFIHIEKLLFQRIELKKLPLSADEKFPRLSDAPLFTLYNPHLQRDHVFDPGSFNPLKYNLEFFAPTDKVYRVDNTDYIIFIKGQNQSR